MATFSRNGPYYPRPASSQDYSTWANFRLRYLHMSESVLCSSQIDVVLVQLFVKNLESPLKGMELKWLRAVIYINTLLVSISRYLSILSSGYCSTVGSAYSNEGQGSFSAPHTRPSIGAQPSITLTFLAFQFWLLRFLRHPRVLPQSFV